MMKQQLLASTIMVQFSEDPGHDLIGRTINRCFHVTSIRSIVVALLGFCSFIATSIISMDAVASTINIYGTNSDDTIVVGKYQFMARTYWGICVNNTWSTQAFDVSDDVYIYDYDISSTADTVLLLVSDGYQTCGGTSRYIYAFSYNGCPASVNVDLDDGPNYFYGSSCTDIVTSGDEADYIYGRDGNDSLSGGSGNDEIYGGAGADYIAGEGDNDYLDGGTGDDTIDGGAGSSDQLYGSLGNDCLMDTAQTTCDCGDGTSDAEECAGSGTNCEFSSCFSL